MIEFIFCFEKFIEYILITVFCIFSPFDPGWFKDVFLSFPIISVLTNLSSTTPTLSTNCFNSVTPSLSIHFSPLIS